MRLDVGNEVLKFDEDDVSRLEIWHLSPADPPAKRLRRQTTELCCFIDGEVVLVGIYTKYGDGLARQPTTRCTEVES
jgi:hypothetical protein